MFLLVLSHLTFASEILEKGSVLKEDSYVFSIEEAESLKSRIIELEKKEKELEEYKKLNINLEKQIDIYKINENLYSFRKDNYDLIIKDYKEINDIYRKRSNFNGLENSGYFFLGVALTIGSIYLADHIVSDITNN